MDFIYHKSAAAKFTLYLSNVPGFLKPVYYGEQPAKRFFSLNSGVGNVLGVSIVSMPEIAQFSITVDKYIIEDIDTFMSYFDDCIKELEIYNEIKWTNDILKEVKKVIWVSRKRTLEEKNDFN